MRAWAICYRAKADRLMTSLAGFRSETRNFMAESIKMVMGYKELF